MKKLLGCLAAAIALAAIAEPVDLVNSPRPQQFQNGAYVGNGTPNGQAANGSLYVLGDAGFAGNVSFTGDAGFAFLQVGPGNTSLSFVGIGSTWMQGVEVLPGQCQTSTIQLNMQGADAGDACFLGLPQLPTNDVGYNCAVNQAGNCAIAACNGSSTGLLTMTGNVKCVVMH